jgi:hypothetical protein
MNVEHEVGKLVVPRPMTLLSVLVSRFGFVSTYIYQTLGSVSMLVRLPLGSEIGTNH